jgi:hypothetical protein
MKIIFLTLFLFASVAGFSQTRVYPKKFNANPDGIYVTNSTSNPDLSFLYKTAEDTSRITYLIEKFSPNDLVHAGEKLQFYNVKLCLPNYQTKLHDFIFSITSESEIIYFFHISDKYYPPVKTNL